MATPTRYTRATSFSGYQATNPNRPLPGPALDNELANIETSVNGVISALGDIRRDDGQLRNGIVGRDALAPDLATGVSPATLWQAGLVYQEQDTVSYLTAFYRCVISHTSDAVFTTDLGAGRWVLYSEIGTLATDAEAARDAAVAAAASAVPAAAAATASAAAALISQNAAAASATAANNVVTSGTVGAVRHDVAQSLTGGQQTQARTNIGAIDQVFGDTRYDRILTSPTALTNGATIPGTENGRFYSMALPTVQTATLPSTSGLPDGFSIIVQATGLPAGYQTSSIAGGGKNILYRGSAVATFFLIGNGEIFRFTWLSGLDQWIAECLQHPAEVRCTRSHNGTIYNSGSTSFTNVFYNQLSGNSAQFNVASSGQTLVPVVGVYQYRHRVFMAASAGGGTSGTGHLIGTSPSSGTSSSAEDYSVRHFELNEDSGFLNIHNTRVLNQGNIVSAQYLMNVTTLWIFPGNSVQVITLVSR
jgi:hypothetical protein